MKNIMKTTILMVVLLASVALLAGCGLFHNEHTGGEATCTEWGKCTVCGEEYIEPAGHTYDDENDNICNVCGMSYSVGLEYALLSDDTYAVVGIGSCTDKDIIIPDYYSGKPVTMVGYDIGSISEKDEIMKAAIFYETGIKSIIIPDTVTDIGDGVFYMCTDLQSVIMGKNVTSVGRGAFANCTSLTSIIIPDSVTIIDEMTFSCCENLTSINMPDSMTSIGNGAFAWCTSLASITIPDSVTSIGDEAFWDCTSLASVTIGDGVTSIGSSAFWGCKNLASINIPDSVTSIGEYAFADCESLKSVYITDIKSWCEMSFNDPIFYYKGNLFLNGELVTELVIPNSVESIREYAFVGCASLESVTIGNNVTSIDNYAFQGCTSLESVTIGKGVTSIGSGAFSNCASLTSITIHDSVTSIGDSAFGACTSLTSINVDENNHYYKSIDENLYSKDGTALIQYAIGKTDTSFTIPDSVTSIGEGAFSNCASLTSITIHDSVTSIGYGAFFFCDSLTEVTIPDSVTSIGGNAFYMCRNLKEITFNGTVAEWNAINKRYNWNYNIPATEVICSDGVVEI